MPPNFMAKSAVPARIRVIVSAGTDSEEIEFDRAFKIGRTQECEVCIPSEFVSRIHANVVLERGRWWVRDLNSSNGLFVQGEKVTDAPVDDFLTIQLGVRGPLVTLRLAPKLEKPTGLKEPNSVERYFGAVPTGAVMGEHTIMVRRAFADIQKKQRWRYRWIVGTLALILMASGGYIVYLRYKFNQNRALAEELFYSMKSLDVNIASIEERLGKSGGSSEQEAIRRLQQSRRETEQNYERFLITLKIYDPKITPQRRLILRIARIFGECELAMPEAFAAEVENYIKKWQSSARLSRAVALANHKGYTAFISREFLERDLPTQFFYLALQESDFKTYNVGPKTRMGYAKGMWQFIPDTATRYGLRVGPLVDLPEADTSDDRQHYDLATKAAAAYIKDLYSTDAQASGLLVMASYNWGENHVLPLIQKMPPNPRERNFWQLLTKYRDSIPPETYDYVFYIASAAAIGEDPRLFGFDFDNPLLAASHK